MSDTYLKMNCEKLTLIKKSALANNLAMTNRLQKIYLVF